MQSLFNKTPPQAPDSLRSAQTVKRSVDLSIGLLVAVLNVIEIVLIVRIKRKKRKLFEIILLSLSVADLLFGLSNGAICVVFLGNWRGETVFDITYTTFFFFVLTSIFHLVFIAIDRLWAIVRPIKHNIFMTRRKVYIALGAVWSLAIVVTLALYFFNEKGYMFKDEYGLEQIVNTTENSNSSTVSLTTMSSITITTLPPPPPPLTTTTTTTITTTLLSRRKRPTPSSRPTKTRSTKTPPLKKPRFREKLLRSKNDAYQRFMQTLLSCFIIGADILLVLIYTAIIYRVHAANKRAKLHQQTDGNNNKIGLVCIFVVASFVLFTVPYALRTLLNGESGFWVNILLVGNSGLNSIIYFFRNHCERAIEQKRRKKEAVSSSSAAFTPVSTPLTSRHNVSDSVNNSPANTPHNLRHTKL